MERLIAEIIISRDVTNIQKAHGVLESEDKSALASWMQLLQAHTHVPKKGLTKIIVSEEYKVWETFTEKVYQPLLDSLPENWLKDFKYIVLRLTKDEDFLNQPISFQESNLFRKKPATARKLEDKFIMNIALERIIALTDIQLRNIDTDESWNTVSFFMQDIFAVEHRLFAFQCFGNIIRYILEMLYEYNKETPAFEDKNIEKMAIYFMRELADGAVTVDFNIIQ